MTRFGMVMDVTRCNGCYNCFVACKDEHAEQDHLPYSAALPLTGQSFITVIEKERGRYPKVKVDYIARLCQQCETMPCADAVLGAAPNAVYRRTDGIVIIDPQKAAGNKDIVDRCPYRVVTWNEDKQVAQKCTLCAHLLDAGWKEPRCVEACPTGALVFGDLDDPGSEISQLVRSGRCEALGEYRLGEKLGYIGLPKEFIAGAVVCGERDEYTKGVDVILESDGKIVATTKTDGFGDFEFEDLEAGAEFVVRVAAPGSDPRSIDVKLYRSVNLGDIIL